MTGQVKEDILVSIGELGVVVVDGKIHFEPLLLRKDDFNADGKLAEFVNVQQKTQRVELPAGSLGFTYCQVPVVYRISVDDAIEITNLDGTATRLDGLTLDDRHSGHVFGRTGLVTKIVVSLKEAHLN